MPSDIRTIELGTDYEFNSTSPCTPNGPNNIHLSTFGPAITYVSASTTGGPPPGLAADVCPGASSTLNVRGIPQAVGVYTYQVDGLLDNGGHVLIDCVHTVALKACASCPGGVCPTINLTPSTLSNGIVGNAYTQALTPTAGVGPYVFDVISGALPTGLSLSALGVISGTPTVNGAFHFVVRVIDSNGCTGVQAFDLTTTGFFGLRVTQTVVLTMAPNIVACPTPDEGEDLCGSVEDPVIFSSLDLGNGRQWSAQVALDDDLSYYGGWKEPRLLSVGEIRRSLSGPNLDYEVGSFNVEYSDEDYVIRSQLAAAPGRYYNKKEVEVYMVTPSARRDGSVAKRISVGSIDSDPEFDPRDKGMSVRFTCRDRIGTAVGWTNTGQSKLPRRVLSSLVLPGCTTSALGLACPIPYGALSTNISASGVFTRPILDVDPTHCGFFDGAYPAAGFGNWNATPLPPSGVTATAVAGGSLTMETPHGEGRYYVQVFPADAAYNIGDPFPYCSDALFVDISPGNQQINVAWTASPGAAKYVVVLGTFYYGVRPQQYIETTGTSCSFTRSPAWPAGATMDSITPGARVADDAAITYYTVRSKNGNTVSEISPTFAFQSVSAPRFPNSKFRPVRVWWQSTGAPEYEVLSAGPGNAITDANYEWKWIVSSGNYDPIAGLHYFDNDFFYLNAIRFGTESARPQGALNVLYTRDVVINIDTWREFMIAGCAIQGVDDWYYDPGGPVTAVETNQGDGTEWLFPTVDPTKKWYTFFNTKYRDIVGVDGRTRRFAMGYGRGPKADLVASGTHRITLNLRGVDSSATGNGTLLTDLHDQFLHFLQNVVAVSGEGYMTGQWNSTPVQGTDGICVIDTRSILNLKEQRQREYPGGILGAGVVGANGEQTPVTDELKRWQISGDFRLGPNRHWQITTVALDENLQSGNIVSTLTDEFDIQLRSFKPSPRLNELYNVIPYKYKRNHVGNGWFVDNQLYTNDDSISRWNVRQESSAVEFHYLRDASTTLFVLGKRARRQQDVPYYVALEGSDCLTGSAYDIGKYIKLDHWRGIGPTGWVGRPLWIMSNTLNPVTRRVALQCMDVTGLIIMTPASGVVPPTPTPSGVTAMHEYLFASDDEILSEVVFAFSE